jgi:hypothetical protein
MDFFVGMEVKDGIEANGGELTENRNITQLPI